jgi:hypothetical protein
MIQTTFLTSLALQSNRIIVSQKVNTIYNNKAGPEGLLPQHIYDQFLLRRLESVNKEMYHCHGVKLKS